MIGLLFIALFAILQLINLETKTKFRSTLDNLKDKEQERHNLMEINRLLTQDKEQAAQGSDAKSAFLAKMSHEIRTPLNAVIGASKMLTKTDLQSNQLRYTKMINSSGELLLGVINDVLDFSKIESGCMELNTIEFNLEDILMRISSIMSVSLETKPLEVAIEVDPAIETTLYGDPLRLQQVLVNLVSNSLKFTELGQVTLKVSQQHYQPVESSNKNRQRIKFEVSDTGMGMDNEQIRQLFQPYRQADETISHHFGGTGLGLVITGQLIELMGGNISVQSQIKQGSTFSFELELPCKPKPYLFNNDLHNARVLIIDPVKEHAKSLEMICKRWRWRPIVLHSLKDVKIWPGVGVEEVEFVLMDQSICSPSADYMMSILTYKGIKKSCKRILIASNQAVGDRFLLKHPQFCDSIARPVVQKSMIELLERMETMGTQERPNPQSTKTHLHEVSPASPARSLSDAAQIITINNHVSNATEIPKVAHALLVEDNFLNQTIALDILEDIGITADIANHGKEALEKLYREDSSYDLVLMDNQMPVMDGIQATKILREDRSFKKPIIALTAGIEASERERYLSAGMNGIISKPIDLEELERVIFDALHQCPFYLKKQLHHFDPNTTSKTMPVTDASLMNTFDPIDQHPIFNVIKIEELIRGSTKNRATTIEHLKELESDGRTTMEKIFNSAEAFDLQRLDAELNVLKVMSSNYGGDQLSIYINDFQSELQAKSNMDAIGEHLNELDSQFKAYIHQSKAWYTQQMEHIENRHFQENRYGHE